MERPSRIVLVVDDDRILLSTFEAILRRGGYSPIAASGPLEALKKSRDFSDKIQLLLTDITMPEMDGLSLADRILAERTDIRVLLISGGSTVPSPLPLLKKPFSMHELLGEVANVIEGPLPLFSDIFAVQNAPQDRVARALEQLHRPADEREDQGELTGSFELAAATWQRIIASRLSIIEGVETARQAFAAIARSKVLLAHRVPCIEDLELYWSDKT